MNSKQIRKAAAVTSKHWIDRNIKKYINGGLVWSAEMIGNTLFLHGSNCKTGSCFCDVVIVQFLIGPRGGLNKVKVI